MTCTYCVAFPFPSNGYETTKNLDLGSVMYSENGKFRAMNTWEGGGEKRKQAYRRYRLVVNHGPHSAIPDHELCAGHATRKKEEIRANVRMGWTGAGEGFPR